MKNTSHPKAFARKPESMQGLLNQLELVQRFAKEGFWVTTEELGHLLEIDPLQFQGQRQFHGAILSVVWWNSNIISSFGRFHPVTRQLWLPLTLS